MDVAVARGPAAVAIELGAGERETLERWARRRRSAAGLAQRSRIVLACAEGRTNVAVAERVGVSVPTVRRWRGRFAERGLDGLLDEPRPGRPRTISDERVEEVIVKTLETVPPDGGTHWSTRQMASADRSQPDRGLADLAGVRAAAAPSENFKLSKDPLFVEKVSDIVGLYLDPPERAVVLCVDEKIQIQALDRSPPILPMLPGTPARMSHDYKRNGTSSLFAALNATTGKVIRSLHARHRAIEFKKFLQKIDKEVPAELEMHLILDNYATHKTAAIKSGCRPPPLPSPFHPHRRQLDQPRRALVRELTTSKLRRGAHRSVAELNADIQDWIGHWNENPNPYVWVKTTEEILDSLASYCNTI